MLRGSVKKHLKQAVPAYVILAVIMIVIAIVSPSFRRVGNIRNIVAQCAVLAIVAGIRTVLELTPPELAADIIDRGIILTGGGALLRGLPQLVTEQTEINTIVADHPLECVALGTGKALLELDQLKESGTVLSAFRKGRRR